MSLRLYRRTVLIAVLIWPGLRPSAPGWRRRDAYSREEDTGSQLDVLPPCYDGGVTAVTDAIVGGSLLAKNPRAPRSIRLSA
ncbi:hypothetical protein C4J92_4487 [Pseudomonas sp. R3-18-08]|nr:hypothetical protein C4J92_4487 [Pseudomonas sp. R3-18-08]